MKPSSRNRRNLPESRILYQRYRDFSLLPFWNRERNTSQLADTGQTDLSAIYLSDRAESNADLRANCVQGAILTLGTAREAHSASVMDEPVTKGRPLLWSQQLFDILFDPIRVFRTGQTQSVTQPLDVRIDKNCLLAESSTEHDTCRFSAHFAKM
jgi:hypothetical protein